MSGISNVPPEPKTQGVGKTGGVTTSTHVKTPLSTKSTLTVSDQEAHTKDPVAARPELPFPLTQVVDLSTFMATNNMVMASGNPNPQASVQDFMMNIQLQMMQNTTNALGQWVKSIQDISAEETKANAKKQIQDTKIEKIRQGVEASNENEAKVQEGTQTSLLLGGLILTGLIPGIQQVASSSMAPLAQAIQAISITGVQALPTAFASLIGIFGTGAALQASVSTLFSGAKEKKTINAEFIKNYAAKIISTVNDKEFTSTLKKLFIVDSDETRVITQIGEGKVILLSTALALSYTAETGGLSGEEFDAMVNGKFSFPAGDPRNALIQAFQQTLASLPASSSKALMDKLKTYFDSKPSIKSLLEPSEALASALAPPVLPISPG